MIPQSLDTLYRDLELQFGESLTDLDTTKASLIAKNILIHKEPSGEFHVEKKPFGWDIIHAIRRFFTKEPKEGYNFRTLLEGLNTAYSNIPNVNPEDEKKLQRLTAILNALVDHINEGKKPENQLPAITWPASGKAQEVALAMPMPPQGQAVEHLLQRVPEDARPKLNKLLKLPDSTSKILTSIPAFTAKLKEIRNKPDVDTINTLATIAEKVEFIVNNQDKALYSLLDELALTAKTLTGFLTSFKYNFTNLIQALDAKVALAEALKPVVTLAVRFETVQNKANALKADSLFSSFSKNLFKMAAVLLDEITSRTLFNDPFKDPHVTDLPFHNAETCRSWAANQNKICAQYERAVAALVMLQEKLNENDLSATDTATKQQFLEKLLGPSTKNLSSVERQKYLTHVVDEKPRKEFYENETWRTRFEKAFGVNSPAKKDPAYQKFVEELDADLDEAMRTTASVAKRGFWTPFFYGQEAFAKRDDLRAHFLDRYVDGVCALANGAAAALSFYKGAQDVMQDVMQEVMKKQKKQTYQESKKKITELTTLLQEHTKSRVRFDLANTIALQDVSSRVAAIEVMQKTLSTYLPAADLPAKSDALLLLNESMLGNPVRLSTDLFEEAQQKIVDKLQPQKEETTLENVDVLKRGREKQQAAPPSDEETEDEWK